MAKLENIARVERATKRKKENNPQSINILEGLEEKINNSSTQYEVEDIINEYNLKHCNEFIVCENEEYLNKLINKLF